ncbi:MAG: hypothetical protein ACLGGV_09240 [Bacteroidia bacterium]
MKGLEKYNAKTIVAWGEAISGNKEFHKILYELDYPELGYFVYALKNNKEARKWLTDNKFFHLVALIQGAEGKKEALDWLEKHEFIVLKHMAMAIDGDGASLNFFRDNDKLIYVLTTKMKAVKDEIEDNNQDPHKISF